MPSKHQHSQSLPEENKAITAKQILEYLLERPAEETSITIKNSEAPAKRFLSLRGFFSNNATSRFESFDKSTNDIVRAMAASKCKMVVHPNATRANLFYVKRDNYESEATLRKEAQQDEFVKNSKRCPCVIL
jgi:cell division septum initiation protein DivIVA